MPRSLRILAAAAATLAVAAPRSHAETVTDWAVDRPAAGVSVRIAKLSAPPRGVVAPSSRRFRIFGGSAGRAGSGYPDNLFHRANHVTGANQLPSWFAAFRVSGSRMRVFTKGNGGKLRIRVDGRLAGTAPRVMPSGGSLYAITVRFRSSRRRSVVLEMGNGFHFGGVVGKVSRSSLSLGRRVIFVGDSFTEPQGALAPTTGFAHRAAFALGWGDAWASGSGGTGYLNPGSTGRTTFGARVASDALRRGPHTVVLAGGINDIGRYGAQAIATEAERLFERIRESGARLVVVGPFWPGEPSGAATEVDAAIRSRAQSAGIPYISPIGERWITGTGRVGAPRGDGNADTLIGPDGTHPTQAGHDHLAQKLVDAVRRLGLG